MMLRAEAPEFLMPPPGLGALCGVAAVEAAWQTTCSTSMPSPTDAEPIYLDLPTDAEVSEPMSDEDLCIPVESSKQDKIEFQLTGMEDLQKSLASLFATLPTMSTKDVIAFPADGSASTCPGTSDEEESTCPSTPQTFEDSLPCILPPGLESEVLPEPALEQATPEAEVPSKRGWEVPAVSKAELHEDMGQTSVMLHNVPRKCTRDLLARRLDEAGFRCEYDLIYVVADLKQKNSCSGCALVNFRSEEACRRFSEAFHKSGVADAFPGLTGKKAIEVLPAPIQGLDANVCKLEKSGVLMSMLAERPGWQPARYNHEGEIEAEIGC